MGWFNAHSPAYGKDGSNLVDSETRKKFDPHNKWSTWAESTWDEEALDIFLIADPTIDKGTLAGGVLYLAACFIGVWGFRKKVEHIELVNEAALEAARAVNDDNDEGPAI